MIGHTRSNRAGDEYIVVDKTSDDMYLIRFKSTGYETKISLGTIKSGRVRDYLKPDKDGFSIGAPHICSGFEHEKWRDMVSRCKKGTRRTSKNMNYEDCEVSDDWKNFSLFLIDVKNIAGWADWESHKDIRFCLDKDILCRGNKVYSKETCCLVPEHLNCFFGEKPRSNSSGLTGVFRNGVTIYTQIKHRGDKIYLGSFKTEYEARAVYLKAKLWALEDLFENEYKFVDDRVKKAMLLTIKQKIQEEDGSESR